MTTITIPTANGDILFVPRDLDRWPRHKKPPTVDTSRLRGVTVHWSGSKLRARYRAGELCGDEALIGSAIATHNALRKPDGTYTMSDVGYNLAVGRTGLVYELRGLLSNNAANGALLPAIKPQYPAGSTTSNPFFQSVFVCAGVDAPFDDVTPAQLDTLNRLYAYIISTLRIKNPILNGHRDVRATACPGDKIAARFPSIMAFAACPPPTNPRHPSWGTWPAVPTKPTVGPGSSGAPVVYLLGVLDWLGYRVVTNGQLDAHNVDAVVAFQRSFGLDPDGVVGDGTWAQIDRAAKQAQ